MVFCPKCGEKQDNNEAKFCQKCGEDIGANNEMHNNHLSNNLNCIIVVRKFLMVLINVLSVENI